MCGSSNIDEVHPTVRDAQAFEEWDPSVVRCRACGIVQLTPIENPLELPFYESNVQLTNVLGSEFDWDAYVRRTEEDAKRRADLIGSLLSMVDAPKILEIGSGYGAFLQQLRGTYETALGIEPGRKRVEKCRSLGLNVVEGFFPADDLDDAYDLVCAFHVLEHISHPRPFLDEVVARLTDAGLFVAEVPNYRDVMNELSEPYRDFHFQGAHKYYYDGETLRGILERTFSRVEIRYVQRYSISNHLHWLSERRPQLQAPARCGDAMEDERYAALLAAAGRTDTLVAIAER